MKYIPWILIATLTGLSPHTCGFSHVGKFPKDHAQLIKPETIKVLLYDSADTILLEAKGSYQIYNPSNDLLMSSGILSKRGFLSHNGNGILWNGDLLPGVFQLRIVPSDAQASVLVNGKQYKGCVEVYDLDGKFRVINEVDVENYLRSSLASQLVNELEPEVMNSLAIIARTYAYALVQKNPKAPWHITADEASYDGYGITLQNVALEEAISETRHAILRYKNQPFAATWTENSAGKTAAFSSIYRKNVESPSGVIVPGMETQRDRFQWSVEIPKQKLAAMAHLPSLTKASVFSDKSSGKVYAMSLGNETSSKTVSFFDLQKALGAQKLKSNDFNVSIQGDSVVFTGYGVGNGVGLCLYSARAMAKKGMDAKQILAQFFPDTQMEKHQNYDELLPSNQDVLR